MRSAIAAITLKDLAVLNSDRRGLGNLFLMPAMFIVVMTLALGKMWGTHTPGQPNAVTHNVPAWTLFGVFFIAQQLAASILEEKKLGTFRRLLAAPVSRAGILIGKLVPYLLLNLAQVAVMFAVGVLVLPLLGAPRLVISHPLALAAISIAASLSATGLGLLIASLAKTTEQIGGLGSLLVVTMAALGGVMVPSSVMPDSMRTLGLATPHAWALRAYQDVLVRDAGLAHVLPGIAALLGFALVFFGVAVWRFRWE
ncbi:MAG TPA: ABC transporter permease [Thermoanaerobaculia bacterium]|nr:ABC transporter permease [Thermoanaerobaculia bacterium]